MGYATGKSIFKKKSKRAAPIMGVQGGLVLLAGQGQRPCGVAFFAVRKKIAGAAPLRCDAPQFITGLGATNKSALIDQPAPRFAMQLM